MEQLIISNLDHAVLVQLKRRAWQLGLPLEEALRRLLAESLSAEEEGLAQDTDYSLMVTSSLAKNAALRHLVRH